jgi:hypothetical protein
VETNEPEAKDAPDLRDALVRRHPFRGDGMGTCEARVHGMETVRKAMSIAGL